MPKEQEEKKKEDQGFSLFEMSRKVLLAGIGAAALAEEEISGFVEKLADRGEIAEKDARKLMKEVMEKREGIIREKVEKMRKHNPVSLATKEDIEALTKKVDELTKKLEELKKED